MYLTVLWGAYCFDNNTKVNGTDWKLHNGGLTEIISVHQRASEECVDCKEDSAPPKNPAIMPDSRDGQVVKLPQIAARERGPGPARYMLKSLCRSDSHDITKHRNPAYSLGPRLQPVKSFNSPGPCYLPAPGVTSVGPDGTPKWSMLGAASKTTKFNPPGPGRNDIWVGNLW